MIGRRALWLLLLGACNQSGISPYGEPIDQVAGFAGTPVMQPGADCLHCHYASAPGLDGGLAQDRPWSIAGTVFSRPTACAAFVPDAGTGCSGGVQGVQVLLTDSNGQQLTLLTNSAGNFYTDQPIGTLTSIMIQNGTRRMVMNLDAVDGGANLVASVIEGYPGSNAVSCNACHSAHSPMPFPYGYGYYSAPGSLFIPEN
jgi:hypothetical protein